MSFTSILGFLLPLIQGRIASLAPVIEGIVAVAAPLIGEVASGAALITPPAFTVHEGGHVYSVQITLTKVG